MYPESSNESNLHKSSGMADELPGYEEWLGDVERARDAEMEAEFAAQAESGPLSIDPADCERVGGSHPVYLCPRCSADSVCCGTRPDPLDHTRRICSGGCNANGEHTDGQPKPPSGAAIDPRAIELPAGPFVIVFADGSFAAAQSCVVHHSTIGAIAFATPAEAAEHIRAKGLSTVKIVPLACDKCKRGEWHSRIDCTRTWALPAFMLTPQEALTLQILNEMNPAMTRPAQKLAELRVAVHGRRFKASVKLPDGQIVNCGTHKTEAAAWQAAQAQANRHRVDVDLTAVLAASLRRQRRAA